MKKNLYIVSLMISLLFILSACNGENSASTPSKKENVSDGKLKIYTTIYPLEDFAKKIGGEYVNVESILPSGADAHTYEPTTKMMVDIANSDGFIYSGVGIESFTGKIEEALKKEDVAFINAGEGIELASLEDHSEEATHDDHEAEHSEEATHDDHEAEHSEESDHDHEAEHSEESDHDHEAEHSEEAHHHHGDEDPHVWIDPVLSMTLAENIKNALVELQPEQKDAFEENFQNLKSQLEALDKSFSTLVNEADKKEILVSHAAYGYWQQRYGIKQISVLGLSPTEEPSQKELKTIIETAKEHDLKYVIFETNVTSNIADIVQSELKAEALTLSNLETITDEDRKNNEDYFSIMEKNLDTLRKALSK
ncbi:metal ABC transporter solute-binding protein, Zn/Mn family [Metabacillus malikii]|uniref:Zinc transport system substrate-binding protein n=1 Tax=Metabacillus malikii TaxID=1504265 RepID=A0ABT9ZFQ2_9BACI|nr:zinc ABC transporter substrate-binding protein [Metabacillus malikii]MDQ0231118.1 zinc transport system substrate-binding protein [Metabacillus malikii]